MTTAKIDVSPIIPPTPAHLDRRTIYTLTSPRYWAGTYILVKMLRHYGCDVQVCVYTTEYDELPDAMRELRRTLFFPSDHTGATVAKARCDLLLNTQDRYVGYLGSDVYPVQNVTPCFEHLADREAIFWEDIPDGDKFLPEQYGLDPAAKLSTFQPQGDSMFLDMEKCWPAVYLTRHLILQNSPGSCGDQTQFRAAWALLGKKQFSYAGQPVDWKSVPHIFLHQSWDGSPLFVHRVGSKWPPMFGSPLVFESKCPEENEAWHYYRQINEVLT